jgi:cyclophilin family peptidyl-prolyl cis-trans isomerase
MCRTNTANFFVSLVLFADHGPHFYINMEKKPNPDLTETCFGKIVEGQEILDFMVSHAHNKFHGTFMAGIEAVKVL